MCEDKYVSPEAISNRLPCIFTSNDPIESYAESEDDTHVQALKNRIYPITMFVRVVNQPPNPSEDAVFLIRPPFNVNGLGLMPLFQKYLPNGIPDYQGETFQDLSEDWCKTQCVYIFLKNSKPNT